jgi:hypothetical protein
LGYTKVSASLRQAAAAFIANGEIAKSSLC